MRPECLPTCARECAIGLYPEIGLVNFNSDYVSTLQYHSSIGAQVIQVLSSFESFRLKLLIYAC